MCVWIKLWQNEHERESGVQGLSQKSLMYANEHEPHQRKQQMVYLTDKTRSAGLPPQRVVMFGDRKHLGAGRSVMQ